MAMSPGSFPSGVLPAIFQRKNPTPAISNPTSTSILPISCIGNSERISGRGAKARLRHQVEFGHQIAVVIDSRIFGGEQLVAVKNGVCPGEKTKRLAFA